MKCLHGELCAQSTTQNGSFWFCNQNPSCNFFCSKDESYTYEKAAAVWKSTKQPHPRCEKHGKLAKMHVVKNLLKSNYGRPFFVCSDQSNPCFFWAWGDVQHVAKPKCRHGFPCVIRKVKKDTINKDRLFFCCVQKDSCNYIEWVPEEPYCNAKLPQAEIKQNDKREEQYPADRGRGTGGALGAKAPPLFECEVNVPFSWIESALFSWNRSALSSWNWSALSSWNRTYRSAFAFFRELQS